MKRCLLISLAIMAEICWAAGLQNGDRLVMAGDSITYQCKYSLIVENYLTMCHPEMGIKCFQSAYYGEDTSRFLKRVKATCLEACQPGVATTCYGMNSNRQHSG